MVIFTSINYEYIKQYVHVSATTLKPLMAKVNDTDHLVTVYLCPDKPWVLALMPIDTNHLPSKSWWKNR